MKTLAALLFFCCLLSGGTWTALGTVINTGQGDEEPTVLSTTTDCIVLSNPCYQIWFEQGALKYTESKDGLGWKLTAGFPLLAVNNAFHACVTKSNGTYYVVGANAGSTQLDIYSSATPTGFTILHSGIIPLGSAGAWDDTGIFNCSLVIQGTIGSGGTAYLMYEAKGTPNPTIFECGTATSTDLATWTKGSQNPVLTPGLNCSAPSIYSIGGTWYSWFSPGDFTIVHRMSSATFNAKWTDAGVATYSHNTQDESAQVADPYLVPTSDGGGTLLYYAGIASGIPGHIKVAVAPVPMSVLVTGNEGNNPTGSVVLGAATISGSVVVH